MGAADRHTSGPPRSSRFVARLALAIAVTAGALALSASAASAVVVSLPGKKISYLPLRGAAGPTGFDAVFSNLDYNGGPVMPSNTNYPVYWRPTGAPGYPAEYQEGVNQFFKDLEHDSGSTTSVESVSAQYMDAAGEFSSYSSHFGEALLDTDPYPASGCKEGKPCLTDAQLRAELVSFVKSRGLPTDLTHEYFLLTPPGVEDCFTAAGKQCSAGVLHGAYCAYHGNVPLAEGRELVYSNDPYVTGNAGCDDGNHPNGKPSDGVIQGGLSHEHNESITDPEPNDAWTDFGGSIGENGDKCRTFESSSEFGEPLGEVEVGAAKYKYNQEINGHKYWYQQEWSNQGAGCLQRLAFKGTVPTAAFTFTKGSGNEVKFDASGSAAPGRTITHYNWQFNESGEPGTPVEATAPTTSFTFSAPGLYTVALTVFTEDGEPTDRGTSAGTAHTVIAGTLPPPAITKLTPAKGPAAGGTTVAIKGAGFTEVASVSFGSLAGKFTVNSSTSITAVAPEASAGTVNVSVTTTVGTSASTTASKYKYSLPTISSVTPNTGSKAGGTKVTITGTGFAPGAGATTIKFGAALASGVTCSSFTSCEATSPAHAVGVADVRATINQLTTAKTAADQFTYS